MRGGFPLVLLFDSAHQHFARFFDIRKLARQQFPIHEVLRNIRRMRCKESFKAAADSANFPRCDTLARVHRAEMGPRHQFHEAQSSSSRSDMGIHPVVKWREPKVRSKGDEKTMGSGRNQSPKRTTQSACSGCLDRRRLMRLILPDFTRLASGCFQPATTTVRLPVLAGCPRSRRRRED